MKPAASPHRLARTWASWALAALCLLAAGAGPAAAQDKLEYAVKATFLYKLAAFVEWPDAAFASDTDPLRICIVGANPFGGQLEQMTAGQRIGQRAIEIRRLPAASATSGCHVAYVAGPTPVTTQALQALRGRPVLTVTDASFQDSVRGVIHFVLRDGRVRFEIDPSAASRNGVTLSSKLASLAAPSRPRSL